jgi:hypothetical protein
VIQMLRRVGKRAGVKGRVNPHAFRHAFAREFILNGGDIGTVSQILGHAQISVTKQFYAVWTTEELKGEHDRFSLVSRLNRQAAARNKDDQVPIWHMITPGEPRSWPRRGLRLTLMSAVWGSSPKPCPKAP